MVSVLQRQHVARVAGKQARRARGRGFGIQQHEINAIAKGIRHRALAPVIGVPRDMIDARVHSAATRRLGMRLMPATTSSALASPSS